MNENIKIGDNLELHCYKHNGKINSISDCITVLDIKDDYLVFGNNKTIVVDSDGTVWHTKESAVLFFSSEFSCSNS